MSHFHLVAYQATNGTMGIAHVHTDRTRPSWRECAEQIPDYFTGRDLGPAPLYTLRYVIDDQTITRLLSFPQVEKVGVLVVRMAARGRVHGIEVLDSEGGDVTFDFPVFCG